MRKAEVLLAYLALAPGIRHPRERLINLLWSDRGEDQARNSLRQCLSAIKKSLGEAADLVLQVDRSTVSLNANLVDVDVHEFERLASEGDFESLKTAADLYQGEFLEGISIRDTASQEWLDNERDRFKRQFIEILLNLAETELVSHDFGTAIKSGERLVKQDPLGEAGWRLLMRSYFEYGDRSHALQAFKRCQQALREELDVDPETATIELRDQIAGGEGKPAAVPTPIARKSPTDSAASSDHSIAVLPFDNLSGDPEQEYFSDGITDSIILNLSMFPGLHVKSRNSSFAFKQQIKNPGEISRELEVDYIVEGSIRKSQERIRITVQLIEAASGNQVWGKRYDAELADLFTLEEELSRAIAATVTGQIESDLQRIAIAKGANNQDAYDLLLDGVYHCHKITREDMVIAIDKLNQCLQLDPDNVRALVTLYTCHLVSYAERWIGDLDASFKLAAECIERALTLAPEEGFVQSAYAEHLVFRGNARKAMVHVDKALQVNQNDPEAITNKAFVLEMLGQHEQALALAELAQRLDPYHPWVDWNLAECQIFSGQYENALQTISNSNNDPELLSVYSIVAYIKLGRQDAAQQALQELLQDCRNSMLTMPTTLQDWLQFLKNYIPFEDSSINDEILECMVQAGLEQALSSHPARSQSDDHSIAVLPFDNLSGDPAQEYFSDGITESIILNLSLFPGLNVKSRNSSFAFKQQIKSPGEISQELEVDYLVEGSIRKTNERVRVTVQLVEATSGNQVWGKRYDAEIEDLFDLEEELSRTIATTVTGQIESDLQRIAITKGAAHQQAYDLLLAGRYHADKGNAQDTLIAIDKFNQCLTLDPGNALAHTTLFWCHDINVIDRWVEDIEHARKLADEHIHKAVALSPELNQVQVAYADYLAYRYRYDEAEQQLRQALEKNPNDSEAIAMQAVNLSLQGKAEDALEKAELALRLDPYHAWARWIKAESQFFSGHFEDCLATIASTENAPGFIQIYNIAANIKLDRLENAQKALAAFLQFCRQNMLSMPKTIPQWLDYYRDNAPFADPATNQEIIDCLVEAGLEDELSFTRASSDPETLPSILVLPFSNLSGDPEQEYFSDGITESIIVNLGTVNGLKVKSIHASFAFKDSDRSLDEIAAELGVQYIVEGSIRKFGDKVRITAQLADTASGNQVWGKRFDNDLEDLFALEEELSLTIAGTVSGRVDKEAQLSAMRKPARDMKSYDYFLRAIHHVTHFNAKDVKTGIELFEKCLGLDPDNATAHATLGSTYMLQIYENYAEDRDQTRKLMMQHLERALELDPGNAITHSYLAEALHLSKDFERGIAHARKAVELNPTLADGHAMLSLFASTNRQHDEAIKYSDLSMQIDPFHPWIGWNAGEIYRNAEDYERAIETFRALPHLSVSVHAQIAACLAGLGRVDEAREEMRQYLALAREQMISTPSSEVEWYRFWDETMPYKNREDTDRYFDLLKQAGLCDQSEILIDVIPSIAVLPFENMSGDPEQEHFADGITTDIIATLSRFRRMRTVARYSILQYKDQKTSIADIAGQQKVRYILEGSVRKSGGHIRVSAELIDAQTNQICWSERFDRDLDDLFVVQDEITQSIALAMKVQMDDGEMALHRSKGATSIRAWEMTLAAVDLSDTYIRQNILDARAMVNEAIRLDPNYAYAWITLGWTYWQEAYSGWSDSIEDLIEEAEKATQHAMSLDPNYGEAWILAGMNHQMKHEPEAALAACLKAVELEPGSSDVHALTAWAYLASNDCEAARRHEQRMVNLCPIRPNWYYGVSAGIEKKCGNLDLAIDLFQQGIEVEPDAPLCRFLLIDALTEKGETVRAQHLADEIRALDKLVTGKGMVQSNSYDAGERQRFYDNLAKFNLV
jgi:TolB-like protein/cytochrome c-type biogenesis protein CcmH/NrfG